MPLHLVRAGAALPGTLLASPMNLIQVSALPFCFPMGDMTAIIRKPEASGVIN